MREYASWILEAGGRERGSWGGEAGLNKPQEYYDRRSLETPEHSTEECQLLAVYDLAPFSNQWFSTLNTLGLSLLILSAHVNQPGSL